MTDPEVLLGWLIAAYLAVACVVAVVASRTGFDIPAAARSTWGRIVPARSTGKPEWTLGPVAVLSLAYVAATAVVVLAWLPVRDLGLPNLVQFASTTASALRGMSQSMAQPRMVTPEEWSTVKGWIRSWKTNVDPPPSMVKPNWFSMKIASRLGLLAVVLDSKYSFSAAYWGQKS